MTFFNFSKPRAVFAAISLFALLSAAAVGNDLEPLEDVTKLTKPTVCYRAAEGLYLIDWDGQNERLWIKGDFNLPAQWSRDGRRASMLVGNGYTHYILDLETGRMTNITERLRVKGIRIYYSAAWWFPNGRQFACRGFTTADLSTLSDIYILHLEKLTLVNITKSPEKLEGWASVSGDGKKIAFYAEEDTPDGKYNPLTPDEIYSMNADGSGIVNLTNTRLHERKPEWSPDGKRIAFRVNMRVAQPDGTETYKREIHVMNADGTNWEPLVFDRDEQVISLDRWSPDSKWLLFRMEDKGVIDLYRVHADTKEIVRITHGAYVGSASWVLAGKSRFLSVDPAGKKHSQWGKIKEAEPPKEENAPAEE